MDADGSISAKALAKIRDINDATDNQHGPSGRRLAVMLGLGEQSRTFDRIVERLEEAGYVERRDAGLFLTSEGRRAIVTEYRHIPAG